jgi:hypothetical protein
MAVVVFPTPLGPTKATSRGIPAWLESIAFLSPMS